MSFGQSASEKETETPKDLPSLGGSARPMGPASAVPKSSD
jgi:hypothetical protein